MDNKFKKSIKQICILFYLIILITIVFVSSFIMFFFIVDNDHTKINKANELHTLNIVEEISLKTDFSAWNKTCDWKLLIVNYNNEIPSNFEVKLKNYQSVEVDERIIPELEEMIQAAAAQNISICISSGYRNLENQNTLFEKKISENMQKGYTFDDAKSLAEGIISSPGTSEHHTGLAIDLNNQEDNFCYTDTYKWLIENSYNYGFILRYKTETQNITGKAFKPWHFRYVGKYHAKSIKENCMCLEEYVSNLMSQQ